MINIEKKMPKKIKIFSPIMGEVKNILKYEEDFFSSEIVGKGIFVNNNNFGSNYIFAPFSGKTHKIIEEENALILIDNEETIKLLLKFKGVKDFKKLHFKNTFIEKEPLLRIYEKELIDSNLEIIIVLPYMYLKNYNLKITKKNIFNTDNVLAMELILRK